MTRHFPDRDKGSVQVEDGPGHLQTTVEGTFGLLITGAMPDLFTHVLEFRKGSIHFGLVPGKHVLGCPPVCLQWHPACAADAMCVPEPCMGHALQAGPVVDAGGLFEYARQTGMIKAA